MRAAHAEDMEFNLGWLVQAEARSSFLGILSHNRTWVSEDWGTVPGRSR